MNKSFVPIKVSDIKEMFWRRAFNSEIASCASTLMPRAVANDTEPIHPWLVVRFEYLGQVNVYAYSRNSSACDSYSEEIGILNVQKQLPHHRHLPQCCFLDLCGLINLVRQSGRNKVRPIGDLSKLDNFTLARGTCQASERGLAKNFVKIFNATKGGGVLKIDENYRKIGSSF